jgi:NAD(P)-dependent dehydrogenase (short-subunit alcohol dehydrogenase family)
MDRRRVVVVGATRGLGLALTEHYLTQGWEVIATTVEPSVALNERAATDARLRVLSLDITDPRGGATLRAALHDSIVHVLHIVAGVFQKDFTPIWEQPDEEILRLLRTNAIGAIGLAERLDEMVPEGGAFVFTSSGMGSLERNVKGDVDLYRLSKVSLNMLVRSFAARRTDGSRAVLLICPGWAKTQMGGRDAPVEVQDSVAGMYRLVVAARPGPQAQFYEYSGERVPW